MSQVVILAGGLAKRLQPITNTIPKCLVEVAGMPFILHQLKEFKNQGIKDIMICIGHLGDLVKNLLGNGSDLSLNITYSEDGEVPLGTGGALIKALPQLPEIFAVVYGDSFLPINYLKVFRAFKRSNCSAMMTVYKNDNLHDRSNILFKNGTIIEYDKLKQSSLMQHIDYGLGIYTKSSLENFQKNYYLDLSDILQKFLSNKQLAAYEVNERFYEIGSHTGLNDTIDYFLQKESNAIYK